MKLFGLLDFCWGERAEGDDLRFHKSDYRCGGPWMTRRVVHDVTHRYGVAVKTKSGWHWFGMMVLANQRVTDEPAPARVDPIAHASV